VLRPFASQPEAVTAYGIASVFCAPKDRKKGYASHMMRLIHHVLSPGSLPPVPPEWGSAPTSHPSCGKKAQFSVLYSDVGDFYKHCGPSPNSPGWCVHSPVSTIWTIESEGINYVDESNDKPELLTEEQCRRVWEIDAQYIRDTFSQLPSSPRARFTFLPNQGVAAFLIRRSAFFLAYSKQFPKYWGISIPHKESSVYATWTLDTDPLQLVVTRLRATPESFPILVRGLAAAACDHGANTTEVWNLDVGLVGVAASLGGKTGPRKDHLPCMAWYGPEDPGQVEWLFNEK